MKNRRPVSPVKGTTKVRKDAVGQEDLPGPGILFKVILKNMCTYPIRALIWADEETGHSTHVVFRQFEKREIEINLLTFRHLQRDPKVRMTRVSNQ